MATIIIGTTVKSVTVAGKALIYVEFCVTIVPEANSDGKTANKIIPAITKKIIPTMTSSKSISFTSHIR